MADKTLLVSERNSKARNAEAPDESGFNAILQALPRNEGELLGSSLESVDLPSGRILCEAGHAIEFAYFLTHGLASILTVMPDGKSVEVGVTGKEGYVGAPLLAGLLTCPTRIVMQIDGGGSRIRAKDLTNALPSCPNLQKALVRYTQELSLQSTQIAACNRLHEVDKRLARWLLMSQDRVGGDLIALTQQALANMLGTRRASVTVAAGILQKAGLITSVRGQLKIKDRQKLERAACECYKMMVRQSQKWESEAQ